ncbi:hypothetical protein ASC78_10200 [Variovorax sp. Root318D1]|uniref:XVIPCD domain-containing protein n=1 Tax=Variovorax sp. Root318D1 TaxID=1736513 RepID=UPI0006FD2A66|nr:XVIPCD domain-containing protein [Variovorax sp. Root318D1]KQU84853.1 hypothetical protein ASC78_10200 [Variovorax sp. Root318D1]
MTITSTDYALLAQDSYTDHERKKKVVLGNVTYRVEDHADNPRTGFQATAYRRVDTGEVVIAFRGTEFGREPVHDGIVDAGMALAGVNAQVADAEAFTKSVLKQAAADAQENNKSINVTVTGHSLGGTLAQLEAHRFGLKGETFNAYGAAGLVHGVPKGGHQVSNHVRAGDAVSAASAHFGEVRVYAVQQDIDTLGKAGYRDGGGALSVRNPAKATDFSAHFVDNFVSDGKTLGRSIISRENEARYHAHQGLIDRYRDDVYGARAIASAPLQIGVQTGQAVGQGVTAVGHAVGQAYDATSTAVVSGAKTISHAVETMGKAVISGAQAASRATERTYDATREQVITGAQRAGQALGQAGEAVRESTSRAVDKLEKLIPSALLLNQPAHPGNAMFKQAQAGMQAIDAKFGRPSDHQTDNAAGHVAVKAQFAGMKCIDLMELGGTSGEKIIAVQGKLGNAHSKAISVDTVAALNTPLAQSSQALAEVHAQAQQVNQPIQMQEAPATSR